MTTHAHSLLRSQGAHCEGKEVQSDAERHLVSKQDVLVETLRQRCGLRGAHDEQHPAAADEAGGQVQSSTLHGSGRMQDCELEQTTAQSIRSTWLRKRIPQCARPGR